MLSACTNMFGPKIFFFFSNKKWPISVIKTDAFRNSINKKPISRDLYPHGWDFGNFCLLSRSHFCSFTDPTSEWSVMGMSTLTLAGEIVYLSKCIISLEEIPSAPATTTTINKIDIPNDVFFLENSGAIDFKSKTSFQWSEMIYSWSNIAISTCCCCCCCFDW